MGMQQEAPAAEVPGLPALSDMATVKKLYQLYHDGNPMYRIASLKAMAKDGKPKNWVKQRWGEVKNFEKIITETAGAHGISGSEAAAKIESDRVANDVGLSTYVLKWLDLQKVGRLEKTVVKWEPNRVFGRKAS
jgi:hypothetical protein